MTYLLLSILFSVLTVSFFKLFERYQVNTLQAIVFNYFTCIGMGNLLSAKPIIMQPFWVESWFPYAIILGFLFIAIFYAIGLTSQKMGVSVSMVAAKLSVVIPVGIAFLFHGDNMTMAKITGVVVSLMAVYFMSKKQNSQMHSQPKGLWLLPVTVFVGSGIIDSMLKYMQHQFIPPANASDILSTVFWVALCLGTFVLVVQQKAIGIKSICWGIALGIPNFFCMYYLVKTLELFESSIVFPINNMAIVIGSTLVSLVFFKEHLSKQNWLGFTLAIISILIISIV
jgi:drug/metabolite transporter (DMT)-like permease